MNLLTARLRNLFAKAGVVGRRLPEIAQANLSALDHLRPSSDPSALRFVVFDLETTGLATGKDKAVSLGAVRIADGLVCLGDFFYEYINPERDMPARTVTVHGITPDMLASARPFGVVLDEFLKYLGTDVLVAHNAAFDLHFVNKEMKKRYGFPLQNLTLDTLLLCRAVLPPRPLPYDSKLAARPFSLDSLIQTFDITIAPRHTALGDALSTAMVFQRMYARLTKARGKTLRGLLKVAGI